MNRNYEKNHHLIVKIGPYTTKTCKKLLNYFYLFTNKGTHTHNNIRHISRCQELIVNFSCIFTSIYIFLCCVIFLLLFEYDKRRPNITHINSHHRSLFLEIIMNNKEK